MEFKAPPTPKGGVMDINGFKDFLCSVGAQASMLGVQFTNFSLAVKETFKSPPHHGGGARFADGEGLLRMSL